MNENRGSCSDPMPHFRTDADQVQSQNIFGEVSPENDFDHCMFMCDVGDEGAGANMQGVEVTPPDNLFQIQCDSYVNVTCVAPLTDEGSLINPNVSDDDNIDISDILNDLATPFSEDCPINNTDNRNPQAIENNESLATATAHSLDQDQINRTKIVLLVDTVEWQGYKIIELEKKLDWIINHLSFREQKDAGPNVEKQLSESDNKKDKKLEPDVPLLPLGNFAAIKKFDLYLGNNKNNGDVIDKLARAGGKDAEEATRLVLKDLITNVCALGFNWAGTQRKDGKSKRPFRQFRNIFNLIVDAVEKIIGKRGDKKSIENFIKTWLKSAKARIQGGAKAGRSSQAIADGSVNSDSTDDDVDMVDPLCCISISKLCERPHCKYP